MFVCGPAAAFSEVKLAMSKSKHGTDATSNFFAVSVPVTFCLQGACSIITGLLLVKSVAEIKNFFAKRNAEEFINVTALWRHALCFSSYLMVSYAYMLFYALACMTWISLMHEAHSLGGVSTCSSIKFNTW